MQTQFKIICEEYPIIPTEMRKYEIIEEYQPNPKEARKVIEEKLKTDKQY